MILGTFIKQPTDVKDYDIEYNEWLLASDAVSSATVTVEPTDELAIEYIYVISPRVSVWLSGGVPNHTYKLTVTATTQDGRVRQDEFRVKVKEY